MRRLKDPALFEGIRDFLNTYLPKVRNSSQNTVSTYRTALSEFICYLRQSLGHSIYDMHIGLMTQINIVGFLTWCRDARGNCAATLNNRLSAMKTFFMYLLEYKDPSLCVLANGIADIHPVREEDKGPHAYLSKSQMRILLGLPARNTTPGFRDLVLMTLLYDSACRIDEVLSLRLKEIRYSEGLCCINVTGKGRKTRNLPLGQAAEGLLKEYMAVFHKEGNKSEYLFYVNRDGVR